MDPYQTLGVNQNASEEEIKKAYKKLASKNHPDRGGDTAKFQDIQSAYQTLCDPQKRRQIDNPQTNFEFNFGGGQDMNDIFSQMFGSSGQSPFGHRRAQPRRNKDLKVNITVTLASTLERQRKTVRVQTTNRTQFEVDLDIPQGVTSGTTIKFSGRGDNFFESLTRGDLYVIIVVEANEQFEVFGENVLTELEVNSFDAIIGCEKTVLGIDGREFKIKIPAGSQHSTKYRLDSQGLFRMNSTIRGDLIVSLIVRTPKLTPEQLNQLVKLRDSF
jgi:curved DNA-binding protein